MATLSASHGPDIADPTPSQIAQALRDIHDDNGSFVILDTEQGFIQAAEANQGVVLEYRLNDAGVLRRISTPIATETAAEAFERFRRGDESWQAAHTWEEQALPEQRSGCMGVVLVLLAVLGGIGAAI